MQDKHTHIHIFRRLHLLIGIPASQKKKEKKKQRNKETKKKETRKEKKRKVERKER